MNKIRYSYFVSGLLVILTKPLYQVCLFLVRFIESKIKVNGFSVTYEGKRIVFPKNVGIGINSKIYWKGGRGFEPLTSRAFISFFKRCDVFFDIGSNFGFYTVLAQKFNKHIGVFSFEPLPNIYRDNLTFNKVNKTFNQKTFNLAMSDKVGIANFFVPNVYNVDSVITSASLEKDFFYNRTFPKREIMVTTTTLDIFSLDYMDSLKDKRIILKIDVEGHECSVLRGAAHFLRMLRPYLIVEVDSSSPDFLSLNDLIFELEYSMYVLTELGYFLIEKEALMQFPVCMNIVMIPNEKAQKRKSISFDSLPNLI